MLTLLVSMLTSQAMISQAMISQAMISQAMTSQAMTSQALTAQSLKGYRGKDGQRVEVVALVAQQPGKGASPNALVRVTGSGSSRDGLVFRGTLREQGRSFVMRYGGQDWVLFTNRDGEVEVSMPGRRESFRAKYDEASTTAGNADELVKVHLSQVADDSIALAEKAEWPNLVAKYEKKAADAAASVSKSCGVQSTVRFRWATFDDETMGNVDAWKLCAPMVAALQSKCAAVKERPAIVCQLGATPAVERLEGVLRLTTTTKGVSTAFVQQELGR